MYNTARFQVQVHELYIGERLGMLVHRQVIANEHPCSSSLELSRPSLLQLLLLAAASILPVLLHMRCMTRSPFALKESRNFELKKSLACSTWHSLDMLLWCCPMVCFHALPSFSLQLVVVPALAGS